MSEDSRLRFAKILIEDKKALKEAVKSALLEKNRGFVDGAYTIVFPEGNKVVAQVCFDFPKHNIYDILGFFKDPFLPDVVDMLWRDRREFSDAGISLDEKPVAFRTLLSDEDEYRAFLVGVMVVLAPADMMTNEDESLITSGFYRWGGGVYCK